jgi:hypothetical protein
VLGPVGTGTSGTSPLDLPDQLGDPIGSDSDLLASGPDQQQDEEEATTAGGGTQGQSGSGGTAQQGGVSSGTGAAAGQTLAGPATGQTDQSLDENDQPAAGTEQAGANEQSNSELAEQATQGEAGGASKEKGGKDNGKIDPSMRLINTSAITVDQIIDVPVTSGAPAASDTPSPSN